MTHEIYDLSPSLADEAAVSGREYGVAPDIHPADYIFRFVVNTASDESVAVQDYFRGGAEAARWMQKMIGIFRPVDQPFKLLEFAAGYGRVTRHLGRIMPEARVIASDIHPAAVMFLEQMGVEAHQSSARPETFTANVKYDVIFALSFFTHMPKSTWARWLRALLRHLEPSGCLIFTTHGVPGMKTMGDAHGRALGWDADGFWFEPMSEQSDIDTAEYGSTGTSFRFVTQQIEAAGAALFQYQERGAGYQDVYVVRNADACDDRGGKVLRTTRGVTPRPARLREVSNPDDCIFYHSMEVPGLGPVHGQWDLRGSEQDCLGGVVLTGKTVLEIGPASGYLTFWMEREGASVTSFDLDDTENWDLVPFAGCDPVAMQAERSEIIRKVNNAWWYTRAALGAKAASVNGTAYDVDETLGTFDIVTINSVLLHLRDPFLAVERAAARTRHQLVITDVSEQQFAADRPDLASELALRFIPRAAAGGPLDAWWYIPSALLTEYLKILGFGSIEKREFKAKFQDGNSWDLYTLVATRV